jgi:integrative and conjugative element protein (TIGR02256 family)
MLTLILPPNIQKELTHSLKRAGIREIGGIMMAEHTAESTFEVKEVTIHKQGTFARFVRKVEDAISKLNRFFANTNNDYKRFNYIGEWHSHPSFEPIPSKIDDQSMVSIITDSSVGANFVVLMIVKLGRSDELIATAHTYLPQRLRFQSKVVCTRG